MSLKFDGKSNWKAFFAKFSRSLFPLPGNMGVYGFLPPVPSGSPPLGRDCPLFLYPSYSSLLWMFLGVSCSLPGVGLVLREHYWQERGGGRYSPPRNTAGGWSREHPNPLMRESRASSLYSSSNLSGDCDCCHQSPSCLL
jgi:hypothetical protein